MPSSNIEADEMGENGSTQENIIMRPFFNNPPTAADYVYLSNPLLLLISSQDSSHGHEPQCARNTSRTERGIGINHYLWADRERERE